MESQKILTCVTAGAIPHFKDELVKSQKRHLHRRWGGFWRYRPKGLLTVGGKGWNSASASRMKGKTARASVHSLAQGTNRGWIYFLTVEGYIVLRGDWSVWYQAHLQPSIGGWVIQHHCLSVAESLFPAKGSERFNEDLSMQARSWIIDLMARRQAAAVSTRQRSECMIKPGPVLPVSRHPAVKSSISRPPSIIASRSATFISKVSMTF